MKMKALVFFCILLCLTSTKIFSQNNAKSSSIEERLIRLEEGQKNLNKRFDDVNRRIDDLRADMNSRFQDLNNRFEDMNNRFGDMQAKFNWLYILLSSIIALNAAMVGSVVWMAKQDRPIGQRHYDELIDKEINLERRYLQLSNDVQLIKSQLKLQS